MTRTVTSLLLAALVWPAPAAAADVIAHPSVTLDADEVRDLYLGERQFASTLRLVPVDNQALRTEFLAKILQTDEPKYAARWRRKAFREGLQAPALKGSDAEVIQFVKSTPGAVGYVSKAVDGVKVLAKF